MLIRGNRIDFVVPIFLNLIKLSLIKKKKGVQVAHVLSLFLVSKFETSEIYRLLRKNMPTAGFGLIYPHENVSLSGTERISFVHCLLLYSVWLTVHPL